MATYDAIDHMRKGADAARGDDRHADRIRHLPGQFHVKALLGAIGGMALCIYSVISYPLVTGGKELVSIPPFVIPAYESMILLGGLANLVGMLALARLPHIKLKAPYDARFTEDRIGIWVPCEGEDVKRVEEMMKGHGAEEANVHA